MHKKLFLPLFLLFAMLGGTVKAAPAMLQAHGIGVVVNDTIIDDDEDIVVDLPINNQQVEYIESTGTQYIDTKYIPNEKYGFYIDFYFG